MQTKKVRFVSTIRWGYHNGQFWTCAGCGYAVQWVGSTNGAQYKELHAPCVECGSTIVRMRKACDGTTEQRAALRQLSILCGTLEAISGSPTGIARSLAFKLGIA